MLAQLGFFWTKNHHYSELCAKLELLGRKSHCCKSNGLLSSPLSVTMSQENNEGFKIDELHKLKSVHFADLIRAAQLVFDPAKGVSGIHREIDWKDFGIPDDVAENLKSLGQDYQYASPHVPIDEIWSKMTPETRIWFFENKEQLWRLEEAFPALDED
jgi:hypothetical protein